MTEKRTELRRAVKHMISELVMDSVDSGEFCDLEDWSRIFGFTQLELRKEIIRQARQMKNQAAGR